MTDDRARKLSELQSFLLQANLADDEVFRTVCCRVSSDLELSSSDLSSALGVSRPTVSRWMCGVTAPHPAMREPIRRFALRRLARLVSMAKGG